VISSKESTLVLAERLDACEVIQAPIQDKSLEEIERDYILKVLEATGRRIEGPRGAARILGLNPSTLRGRIAKLRITRASRT
jgi:transcriptional regulator with GAF, ATPase, and Fis domain